MKKLLALVLALVMVMSMAFASAEDDGKLHIVFWHTRGAGVQENTVNTQCQMFNGPSAPKRASWSSLFTWAAILTSCRRCS